MFRKPSFLERLTGSSRSDAYEDESMHNDQQMPSGPSHWEEEPAEAPPTEGELPVDMYVTADNIVIRTLVAGVNPEDLDIAITRDMVTIRGAREEDQEAPDEDYRHRELYWGSFSRTITLPEEVIIDEAEAKERHGLLTITLPKVDKDRSARLKVKPH